MTANRTTDEPEVLQIVLDALNRVNLEGRERILGYVSSFFGLDVPNGPRQSPSELRSPLTAGSNDRKLSFVDRETISPKDFLHEKQPKTGIERVACLAYYLTHYLDTPHFKTIDISNLNTDAAQLKFSNPAQTVKDAIASQLIVPAGKGARQMSAIGERYVDALPDRGDAKAVLASTRPRCTRKKRATTKKTRKAKK